MCRLFSVSKQQQTGCKWLRTKYTRIHLSTDWDCFFPQNWTDFLFQELPEEIQSKMVYIYSVINEYSLRSRDVHPTPPWHKWSDFEYRPWCLAIVVRTPPGRKLWKRLRVEAYFSESEDKVSVSKNTRIRVDELLFIIYQNAFIIY